MRDLVDGAGVGVRWMVADAKGGKHENGLSFLLLDAEDHPELAIRGWKPELYAMPKFSSIRPFLIAGEEASNRDPFSLELVAGRYRHFPPGTAGSPQVLSKGSVVE